MKIILLIIVTFVLGFFSAIPIGAVQLEVIKRALHARLRSALSLVAGAFAADYLYGMVALHGIFPILSDRPVMRIFEFISALILCLLSYITLKNRNKLYLDDIQHFVLRSKRFSMFLGFILALTNPVIIFWWLLCANIVGDIGLYTTFTRSTAFIAVSSGTCGLVTYLILLMFIIRKVRKFISHSVLSRINLVLGMLLGSLSVYFCYTALK